MTSPINKEIAEIEKEFEKLRENKDDGYYLDGKFSHSTAYLARERFLHSSLTAIALKVVEEIGKKTKELEKGIPDNVGHPKYEIIREQSRCYDEAISDLLTSLAEIKKSIVNEK